MQIIFLTSQRAQATYLLGQVPYWLRDEDPRPAREQLNERYQFGGWQPIKGATLGKGNAMCYPGDPPVLPLVELVLRKERIFCYPHEFWGILSDGKAEFARMD